jgi:hypothetical protein
MLVISECSTARDTPAKEKISRSWYRRFFNKKEKEGHIYSTYPTKYGSTRKIVEFAL